jgi:hypothetical protein
MRHTAGDYIPGEQLDFVEGKQFSDHVAPNEPPPSHFEYSYLSDIHLSTAAHFPGLTGNHKLVARHINRAEWNLKRFALKFVQLCIDQNPTVLTGIPIFTYPMILIVPWQEIRAKPTSGTGRYTLETKDRCEHQAEIATVPNLPVTDGSMIGEKTGIVTLNQGQFLGH